MVHLPSDMVRDPSGLLLHRGRSLFNSSWVDEAVKAEMDSVSLVYPPPWIPLTRSCRCGSQSSSVSFGSPSRFSPLLGQKRRFTCSGSCFSVGDLVDDGQAGTFGKSRLNTSSRQT